MTERLDRIEATLERMAERQEADRREMLERQEASRREMLERQEADRREMAELRSAVESLVQVAETHQRNFEVAQQNFDRIWDEIRGIRTENQRMLQHLFGEQNNGQE